MILDEYTNHHQVKKTPFWTDYSGIRNCDNLLVTICVINTHDLAPANKEELKKYYLSLKDLRHKNMISILAVESSNDCLTLVKDKAPDMSLAAYQNNLSTHLEIKTFLKISIEIADLLYFFAEHNIIHGAINPNNIFIDCNNTPILNNFLHYTLLNKNLNELTNNEIINEILPYISPEQTGRTDQLIDTRSDFYSLGATLYLLLTKVNHCPIDENPLNIISAHLANQPPFPHILGKHIPLVISKIIMKLLSKNPGARYQSGMGLAIDLKKCLNQLEAENLIENFELGQNDIFHKLQIPEKLYGRKELTDPIREYLKITGGVIDPHSAYLLIRGLKTFELRMQRMNESGQKIAEYLEKHPKVKRVYYPGLKSHPHHEVAKKQMKGYGGVVTFEVKDDTGYVLDFLGRLKILNIGPSLGGVESLITHPATISYYKSTKQERLDLGITDGLIRLAVGVENVEDIIADIDQAF